VVVSAIVIVGFSKIARSIATPVDSGFPVEGQMMMTVPMQALSAISGCG
jgi:hypothetical protein